MIKRRSAVFAIFGGALLARAGGIALAQTKSAEEGQRLGAAKEPLVITVQRGGKVFIQQTEIPPPELAMKLRAILNGGGNGPVYVRADKSIDYGTLTGVLSQIGASGFKKIILVTAPPTPQ